MRCVGVVVSDKLVPPKTAQPKRPRVIFLTVKNLSGAAVVSVDVVAIESFYIPAI